MAEPSTSSPAGPPTQIATGRPPQYLLRQIYARPVPIRTFPLPSFYPSNPLSLAHVVYAWLSQTIFARPANEPSTTHRGAWSPETRSVHITDPASIRVLWEQGFFGKGNLSRSEANWLKREMERRGLVVAKVAEQITSKRREDRMQAKWERARIEQEAIERTRLEEAQVASLAATKNIQAKPSVPFPPAAGPPAPSPSLPQDTAITAPVGPLQLLQLPNSEAELKRSAEAESRQGELADLAALQALEGDQSQTSVGSWHWLKKKQRAKSAGGKSRISQLKSARAPKAAANGVAYAAPVGPLQLLRLPNSAADMHPASVANGLAHGPEPPLDVTPTRITGQPIATDRREVTKTTQSPGSAKSTTGGLGSEANGDVNDKAHLVNGTHESNGNASPMAIGVDDSTRTPKRRKSVRFSPEVKSATFDLLGASSQGPPLSLPKPATESLTEQVPETASVELEMPRAVEIENREHLQLSLQEAFYLSFAIGALAIVDPKTQSVLSPVELLYLFGDHSFFPPRISNLGSPGLRTDDPFLVHYVVYHHFRSLGWVPREGVKFGVDWLLYRRGPVFDHAEFGMLVIPSYSDPAWDGEERRLPQRQPTWHWLHSIQRVLSHVLKSLVLVYVDIPPQSAINAVSDAESGISGLLKQYRVREVMVRRWSSNRNR